jgi:hypothetical protein
MKFSQTAAAIGEVKQKNGFRILGQAFLGDGSGIVVADKVNRLANYWEPAPGGEQRIVSTAYLWVGSQIPFENISASKLVVVDIGYPPNDDRVHILWQNGATGIASTGGYTLTEQKTHAAAHQPLTDVPDWRATVSGTEVYIAEGKYIDASGDEQKWYGGNTGAAATALATRSAALTSGQHQLCWVTFDLTNGIIVTEAATAVTAVGTLPSRNEFLDADYTVTTTNRKLVPVYLYYQQASIADADILRKWDMRWPISTPSASDENVLDSILTDGNGDVLSDGNGDVLYE